MLRVTNKGQSTKQNKELRLRVEWSLPILVIVTEQSTEISDCLTKTLTEVLGFTKNTVFEFQWTSINSQLWFVSLFCVNKIYQVFAMR